ncbi:c-type cytochrome (plasmid) [Paraburkholderia strydomiana]
MKPISMIALAASALACLIDMTSPPAMAGQLDVEAGQALYMKKGCYECHGPVGQGSIMSGPALAPSPLPVEVMTAYVRSPKGQMPLYSSKILSDRDLVQIHAYLAAIPASPEANRIGLLSEGAATSSSLKEDDGRGQQVYVARCASCHGASGGGGVGPSLVGVTQRRGVSGVESFVRNPSGAMPRLFPQVLTESDVQAVAQYVAGLR